MKMNCIRFFLKADEYVAADDRSAPSGKSALATIMAASKQQQSTCVWPFDYPAGTNQSTRDVLNRMLGALRADPETYGGFSTTHDAERKDNSFFWRLAVIVENLVPHSKAMSDRSAAIPEVFMVAGKGGVNPHTTGAMPKSNASLTQERCAKFLCQLMDMTPKPMQKTMIRAATQIATQMKKQMKRMVVWKLMNDRVSH